MSLEGRVFQETALFVATVRVVTPCNGGAGFSPSASGSRTPDGLTEEAGHFEGGNNALRLNFCM